MKQQGKDSDSSGRSLQTVSSASSELDNMHPFFSDALVCRRLLMKALLRAISLGTTNGNTSRIYGSEESLLLFLLQDKGIELNESKMKRRSELLTLPLRLVNKLSLIRTPTE